MIKFKNIVITAFNFFHLLVLLSPRLFAQAPDTLWTKVFVGERNLWGHSVQQTKDGGYIIAGKRDSFTVDMDCLLIKTDDNGDTLWTKIFGGSVWDEGSSVQQVTGGGYVVCGTTGSFGAGRTDVWLIKTDENGDTIWTKTYGGSGTEYGLSVQQTADSGYIITGWTWPVGGWEDGLLIKTDGNGDTLWTRTFSESPIDDAGYSVQQVTDGGYIVCGITTSYSGGLDALLIKFDKNGNKIWSKTFGGSGIDKGLSVRQTTDGGYIVCGSKSLSEFGNRDIWLIKTDENGDSLWSKTFGGSSNDEGYSVQQTADGGYIICGETRSFGFGETDIWLIRTDENGGTLWTKIMGGSSVEQGYSVQQTIDGGYIVCGMEGSFGPDIYWGVWLIKLKPDPPVKVETEIKSINHFKLKQNYPNPFNPTTSIQYAISSRQFVELKVYDVLGNEITTLVNEEKPAGSYEVEFDTNNLTSGVNFYRLQAGGFVETKKMLLMK